jgi:hypothetical protein
MSSDMKNLSIFGAAGLLALVGSAFAGTATVDGTRDAVYGSALALQAVQTQFGDANGNLFSGGGGELDGLYATADNTNLYVFLAGNQETNGNAIFLLADASSISTGTNVLPNITGSLDDLWASSDSIGGTTLSASFAPEFGLVWKFFGNPLDYAISSANFAAASSSSPGNQSTGATANPAIGSVITIGSNSGFRIAINNANSGGVTGGDQAFTTSSLVSAVSTGIEIQIPLAALGLTAGAGQNVKLLALYTSGSFGGDTFASNQVLPPVAAQGNLGSFTSAANKAKLTPVVPATYTLPAANVNDWAMY